MPGAGERVLVPSPIVSEGSMLENESELDVPEITGIKSLLMQEKSIILPTEDHAKKSCMITATLTVATSPEEPSTL